MIMIIFLLEIRTYKKGSGRMNYETYIKDIKRQGNEKTDSQGFQKEYDRRYSYCLQHAIDWF